MRPMRVLCLLSVLFWAPASRSQTAFFDFNTAGQYLNKFTPWNDDGGVDGGSYSFAESINAGAGGSGGVSEFQSADTTATCGSASWNFSTTVGPGLRGFKNAGIDAWDNFLVCTPAGKPVITLAVTNLNPVVAGNPVTFKALADGPGPISYTWLTNGVGAITSTNFTYTTPSYN